MEKQVKIIGIEREYPNFKYGTNEFIEILGNKLSDKVKENIQQLGVENRYFLRPIEQYIGNSFEKIGSLNDGEPISDLCSKVAKKCLSNLGLKVEDVTCLVSAFENNDFLSPGMSSVLLTKIGLDKFLPHYSLQGMACSTFPKLLELGKKMIHNENDKILFVISGCNSGWYLPHLKNDMSIKSPREIGKDQYD